MLDRGGVPHSVRRREQGVRGCAGISVHHPTVPGVSPPSWRGTGSIAASAATEPRKRRVSALRVTIPSRKARQAGSKEASPASIPALGPAYSLKPPRRDAAHQAGRARSKGGSSPCSPGQAARLRVAPVPRREGRRACDLALPAWSRGPHDGAAPGNRQAGQREAALPDARQAAHVRQTSQDNKQELGGSPRIRPQYRKGRKRFMLYICCAG